MRRLASAYLLPHLLNRDAGGAPFDEVMIIGAGSGNDVAAALRFGAKRVDAVEIRRAQRFRHAEVVEYADGAGRNAVAARLVARELGAIQQEHVATPAREGGRGRAPRGTGTDDDDVVITWHWWCLIHDDTK